jgi:hypothetical protein
LVASSSVVYGSVNQDHIHSSFSGKLLTSSLYIIKAMNLGRPSQ